MKLKLHASERLTCAHSRVLQEATSAGAKAVHELVLNATQIWTGQQAKHRLQIWDAHLHALQLYTWGNPKHP